MATKTSYEIAPLEYFTAGQAAQFIVPPRSVLGNFVKFGKDANGRTIFEYIDPDTPHVENVYEKDANGRYKWSPSGNLIPVLNPDGTQKTQIARFSDGTPVTNRTELARNGDALAISPDGRSLMSTMTGDQRSVTGMSAGMGWTLDGSDMNETLTFSGNNGMVSGRFSMPTYGVANIPTEGVAPWDLQQEYQKYLYGFSDLAKGVQQRITSKTVTDDGILGDIKDTIGKLGPLAPIALSFALPGVGTAIGTALGVSGTAAAIVGNTLVNTALNGGDIGKALSSSLIGATGLEAGTIAGEIAKGGEFGTFLQNNPQYLANLANNVTQTALKGGDVESALGNTLFGTGVSMATSQIPGYDQLAPTVKASVDTAVTQALQGKDITTAAINAAIKAGQSAMATSTNVPTETEVQKQQDELQKQLAPYETPTPEPTPETTPTTPDYPVQEMQITPENLASFQDTLSSNFQGSQWKPGEGGDYTLTGDDGSTITMHKDGTTTATEAPPENLLDAIGATGGQPTQTTPTGGQPTQTTATGGTQPTQTTAAPTPEAAPKGLSVNQLASLYSLFEGEAPAAAPQAAEQGAAGAQAYVPAKEASFLGALGEKPHYLEGLDPETAALLKQIGIDPAELMAQQEAEGGAEDMGEQGEEGVDALEASGRLEGYKTPAGIKRGLPAGTFGLAGSDVAKAYQKAMQDRAIDYTSPYKQPIDEYYQNYLKKLGPAAEATLNEAWGPYVAGRGTQLAGSGAPVRRDPTSDVIAYVPTSSIGASKYYDTAGLSPQLIAMVGEDPSLLNDPDRLALVMSHELAHAAPQRSVEGPNLSRVASAAQQAGQTPIGSIGGGKTQAELFKDLAGARDYLSQQYGYKGVYDQRTNMPLEELLADVGGWSMQSGVDLTKDPYIQQNVLNTPEKMAVYNVMHPKRSVQFDPFYPPVGEVTAEDFLPYKPPKNWLFQQQIKKRMAGMFEGGAIPSGGISGT